MPILGMTAAHTHRCWNRGGGGGGGGGGSAPTTGANDAFPCCTKPDYERSHEISRINSYKVRSG